MLERWKKSRCLLVPRRALLCGAFIGAFIVAAVELVISHSEGHFVSVVCRDHVIAVAAVVVVVVLVRAGSLSQVVLSKKGTSGYEPRAPKMTKLNMTMSHSGEF